MCGLSVVPVRGATVPAVLGLFITEASLVAEPWLEARGSVAAAQA